MQRRGHTTAYLEQKLFWGLLSLILVAASLYIYFVSSSIVNVIVRGEIEKELSAVGSRISELESTYLARKEAIDGSYAAELGFVATTVSHYAARTSDTRVTVNR